LKGMAAHTRQKQSGGLFLVPRAGGGDAHGPAGNPATPTSKPASNGGFLFCFDPFSRALWFGRPFFHILGHISLRKTPLNPLIFLAFLRFSRITKFNTFWPERRRSAKSWHFAILGSPHACKYRASWRYRSIRQAPAVFFRLHHCDRRWW